MSLPRALHRWRDQLSLFPAELGLVLGGLVARLCAAVDVGSPHEELDSGDIDGFDGIARRGSYERLLATEWAIQQTAPIEFLRRAASGEHSFLHLARREPTRPRGAIALFDAGPDQLGACRLAQLAILVLLVERARRTSSAFGWQLLHGQGEALFTTFDEKTVEAFLKGRTALRTSDVALADWAQRFAGSECWLVGSMTRFASIPEHARAIHIHEPVSSGATGLVVAVRAPRRPVRTVELELPEPSVAARVLRDPFESTPSIAVLAARPGKDLLMLAQGGRIFWRDPSGALFSLATPNSPRHVLGRPRRYLASGGTVIGVGRRGGKLVWLSVSGNTILLHATDRSKHRGPHELPCPAPLAEPVEGLREIATIGSSRDIVIAAPDGSLWRLRFDVGEAHQLMSDVTAFAVLAHDALIARRAPSRRSEVFRVSDWERMALPADAGVPRFVRTLSVQSRVAWAVASEQSSGTYRIDAFEIDGAPRLVRSLTFHPPSGTRVVGVDLVGGNDLGLYLIDDDSRVVSAVGRSSSLDLVRTSVPIRELAIATGHGRLAYVTEADELGFVERSGKTLWRGALAPP